MAIVLKLHREYTYVLPPRPTSAQVIECECLRRTFWVLKVHDQHLSSGSSRPASFAPHDIDALLPSDEDDFLFGFVPANRSLPPLSVSPALASATSAVLPGIPAGVTTPATSASGSVSPSSAATLSASSGRTSQVQNMLTTDRSLFATMILSGDLWSRVAQFVSWKGDLPANSPAGLPPWDLRSEYHIFICELEEWEAALPVRHQFSQQSVKAYRTKQLELVCFLFPAHLFRMLIS